MEGAGGQDEDVLIGDCIIACTGASSARLGGPLQEAIRQEFKVPSASLSGLPDAGREPSHKWFPATNVGAVQYG